MKRVLIIAATSLAAYAIVGAANAQSHLPAQVQGAVQGRFDPQSGIVLVSDLLRGDAGQFNDEGLVEERPGLPPRAILSMLDSSGFSVLSPLIRRGPAYVVAVIDPNGTDGRVIVDAASGRIVRFRPISGEGAMIIPDDVRGAYARQDVDARRELTPPRDIPNVRPRPAAKLADHATTRVGPSDAYLSSARPATRASVQHEKTVAAAVVPAAKPEESKSRPQTPTIQLQPTKPMPPVQGFD